MKEFARIRWMEGIYKVFLEKIDDIPVGAIIFCTDVGKLFVKTKDNLEEYHEENIEQSIKQTTLYYLLKFQK